MHCGVAWDLAVDKIMILITFGNVEIKRFYSIVEDLTASTAYLKWPAHMRGMPAS